MLSGNIKALNTKLSVSTVFSVACCDLTDPPSIFLSVSLNLLNLVQNFIIVSVSDVLWSFLGAQHHFLQTSGLLIGSMMVAYQITTAPEPTAAPFVFWLTYLAQVCSSISS